MSKASTRKLKKQRKKERRKERIEFQKLEKLYDIFRINPDTVDGQSHCDIEIIKLHDIEPPTRDKRYCTIM